MMNQVISNYPSKLIKSKRATSCLVSVSKGDILVPEHEIVRLFNTAGSEALNHKQISQELKNIYIESLPVLEDISLEEIRESVFKRLVDTMRNLFN
jgi:hypothetical protein